MSSIDRLRNLLLCYGGDPSRWPQNERDPALALISRDGEAARLLAEARALDRALDDMPDAGDRIGAVRTSIMAALAKADTAQAAPTATLPPSDRRLRSGPASRPARSRAARSAGRPARSGRDAALPTAPARPLWKRTAAWASAAAMAASLLIGIYIGATGAANPAIQGVLTIAGVETAVESGIEDFALTSDGQALEELL